MCARGTCISLITMKRHTMLISSTWPTEALLEFISKIVSVSREVKHYCYPEEATETLTILHCATALWHVISQWPCNYTAEEAKRWQLVAYGVHVIHFTWQLIIAFSDCPFSRSCFKHISSSNNNRSRCSSIRRGLVREIRQNQLWNSTYGLCVYSNAYTLSIDNVLV